VVAAEKLRFYVGGVVGIGGFLAASTAALVEALVCPRGDAVAFFTGIFCRPLARMLGWSIRVDGAEILERERPCVVVANHQSALDVVVYGAIVPPRSVAIGKKSIAWIPLFGWLFAAAGCILVDRDDPESSRQALDQAAARIRERRLSVWMMPEAHRNASPALLPFKTGAFRLAASAEVPVVPLVAGPLSAVVDTRRRRARPGTVRIQVLEPVRVPCGAGRDEIAEIAAETRRRMQSMRDELCGGD
jgi:1-acyl-sn-glycerol-3-phosphate acyltransferase